MTEIWLPAPGLEGRYEVSSEGRIRNARRNTLVAPVAYNGYARINARVLGTNSSRSYSLHRLVCTAFHGPPPTPRSVVMHLNDIRWDNRASNLKWASIGENVRAVHASQRTRGADVTPELTSELEALWRAIRRLANDAHLSDNQLRKIIGF
ncbi:NUMOD4 [uncultured Caudovirales phage]|jgi:hypothetical protein|uniref:NUMOD4 n=1 Tax=uncultured Caudovirales phage TaxID=2100421 RepID=A0A6J5NJY5_9CAUD|nr:NUMOD4 [uncultured Caudovirales phage]